MLRDMPKDTPHVFVNNDRQLVSMCEMCKFTHLRLCISVKNGNLGNHDQGFSREDTAVDGKGMEIRIRMLIDRRVIKNQKWKFLIFMMQRIVLSKSDKKLLVVKYADISCNCMVRAAKTNPTSEFSGNSGLNMKPELISSTMKKRYGLDSKYWKIWKARKDARTEVLEQLQWWVTPLESLAIE
ncbi:hypothetical protein F2Q69_00052263 [Brassica cretica]|uniref:Transposase MuDR plant domain-containing protein n=1 Tax=Brassica cretica TaxID=69181 RepID=A0A8S9MR84_BRACR|nr:hypothetical protein F2Q69_00052263 [Brassica cretica]